MQIERNCNMGYPIPPMMPLPYQMPNQFPNMDNNIEQRLSNIEKRLSILESNLTNQNYSNMNNYQVI